MALVSENGEEILVRLVEWEMFGREDVDPKTLLRRLTLADLATVSANLDKMPDAGRFVAPQMVSMELLQRQDLIASWDYTRDGDHVQLSIKTKQAISYIPLTFLSTEAQ